MAKKFNFADAANTPIAQSATETMAKAYNQAPQTHPLTPSRNEGGGIDTPSADTQSTSDTPSLNGRAGEGLPSLQSTSLPSPNNGERQGIGSSVVQSTSLPSPNNGEGQGIGSVLSPIEHLAQRRIQVINEYNDAAVQAINLKTFPEAGNWKLEEVVRMFNLKRTPGTPKLTKGALAEMLLLDAANDLYEKVCGR